jgi:hypothetical protein
MYRILLSFVTATLRPLGIRSTLEAFPNSIHKSHDHTKVIHGERERKISNVTRIVFNKHESVVEFFIQTREIVDIVCTTEPFGQKEV